METLIKQDDLVLFLIDFEKDQDFESWAEFTVYEVTSWSADDNSVNDSDRYLSGSIKWDGCSHINFGDDGYIHLCGKTYFDRHNMVMEAIWDLCSKKIKNFDFETAS